MKISIVIDARTLQEDSEAVLKNSKLDLEKFIKELQKFIWDRHVWNKTNESFRLALNYENMDEELSEKLATEALKYYLPEVGAYPRLEFNTYFVCIQNTENAEAQQRFFRFLESGLKAKVRTSRASLVDGKIVSPAHPLVFANTLLEAAPRPLTENEDDYTSMIAVICNPNYYNTTLRLISEISDAMVILIGINPNKPFNDNRHFMARWEFPTEILQACTRIETE